MQVEVRMARYFFNIRSGGDYVADDDGEDCPSLQAAGTRALGGARVLLQELHDSRRAPQAIAFEITDQLGRLCLRIPFTLAQRSPANAGVGEVH
jgi:uncharacterized protein DUF6894